MTAYLVHYPATKISILDLDPYMFGDVDQQIDWFQSKGFLAMSKTCPACSHPAQYPFVTDRDVVTLPVGSQQGFKDGTFFAKTLQQ